MLTTPMTKGSPVGGGIVESWLGVVTSVVTTFSVELGMLVVVLDSVQAIAKNPLRTTANTGNVLRNNFIFIFPLT